MGERIVAVVGARLNSSRLPKKHFLPLAGKPLIERLWDRLEKVSRIDEIVLATTDDDYNEPLKRWAHTSSRKYVAYAGDVNDLVGRVDDVVRLFDADILVYVCGDCPLVEAGTIDRMLEAIVGCADVETVGIAESASGTRSIHEGFDVYRRAFWDRMVSVAAAPFEREHIGAVYHHLKKVEPVGKAEIIEPDDYYAVDHRISVDTPSDYRFMRKIYADWYAENGDNTTVALPYVIKRLQKEPSLRRMNQHVYQKKIKDKAVKVTIVTESGPGVGMGHLTRMLVAVAAFQDYLGANVTLKIRGEPIELPDLALVRHEWVSNLPLEFWRKTTTQNDVVIFDLKECPAILSSGELLSPNRCMLVGVDLSASKANPCDLSWIPSFYINNGTGQNKNSFCGWDCFLLRDGPIWSPRPPSENGKRVLVLSGGSDAAQLGEYLPDMLLSQLPESVSVDWVQGPYAAKPTCSLHGTKGRFEVIYAPEDLPALFVDYDAVVCVYGVSYFECLRSGVPTIVFDAIGAAQKPEWRELQTIFPNNTAADAEDAVLKLTRLVKEGPGEVGNDIVEKLRQGPRHFAEVIASRLLTDQNT